MQAQEDNNYDDSGNLKIDFEAMIKKDRFTKDVEVHFHPAGSPFGGRIDTNYKGLSVMIPVDSNIIMFSGNSNFSANTTVYKTGSNGFLTFDR